MYSISFCSVVIVHRRSDSVLRYMFNRFCPTIDCALDRRFFRSIEFAQDMVAQPFGVRRGTDPNSQPHKSLAQMDNNRFQTVVASVTPCRSQSEPPQG